MDNGVPWGAATALACVVHERMMLALPSAAEVVKPNGTVITKAVVKPNRKSGGRRKR